LLKVLKAIIFIKDGVYLGLCNHVGSLIC